MVRKLLLSKGQRANILRIWGPHNLFHKQLFSSAITIQKQPQTTLKPGCVPVKCLHGHWNLNFTQWSHVTKFWKTNLSLQAIQKQGAGCELPICPPLPSMLNYCFDPVLAVFCLADPMFNIIYSGASLFTLFFGFQNLFLPSSSYRTPLFHLGYVPPQQCVFLLGCQWRGPIYPAPRHVHKLVPWTQEVAQDSWGPPGRANQWFMHWPRCWGDEALLSQGHGAQRTRSVGLWGPCCPRDENLTEEEARPQEEEESQAVTKVLRLSFQLHSHPCLQASW